VAASIEVRIKGNGWRERHLEAELGCLDCSDVTTRSSTNYDNIL
jgi:hypothetical protein